MQLTSQNAAFIFLAIICWTNGSFSFSRDEIKHLPGLSSVPPFKQFSGYLDAGRGRHLHYWFVESERDPANDPLLVWLNGGPGCSSLGGFFTELGPFKIDYKNHSELYYNEFAWNKRANVIFLESPAGVGFSYQEDNQTDTNDDDTAQMNLQALLSFFQKFPQYKDNDLFLTGESYAGIYIPTLASNIVKYNSQANDDEVMNFIGYAIGNGFLDEDKNSDSFLFMGYMHGIIGTETWMNVTRHCCDEASQVGCMFSKKARIDDTCRKAIEWTMKEIAKHGHLLYSIYKECDMSKQAPELQTKRMNSMSRFDIDLELLIKDWRKQRSTSSNLDSLIPKVGCLDFSHVDDYLSDVEVMKAIHVREDLPDWTMCSYTLNYTKQYESMREHILFLHKQGIKGMIYNGDTDLVCSFLGDQWFTDSLGFKEIKPFASWVHEQQVAGRIRYFDKLVFTTIRGAGHMVPEDKPSESLKMLDNFLEWVKQ